MSYCNFCMYTHPAGADPEVFQKGGGWGGKFWKKNVCWHVHIKTRQTFNSFFFLFKRIVSIFWKGCCNPRNPPLDPPMPSKLSSGGHANIWWFLHAWHDGLRQSPIWFPMDWQLKHDDVDNSLCNMSNKCTLITEKID